MDSRSTAGLGRSSGRRRSDVSILVVMEVGQRQESSRSKDRRIAAGFNPCCHGSRLLNGSSDAAGAVISGVIGFNPCCHGSLLNGVRWRRPRYPLVEFQSLLSWKLINGSGVEPGEPPRTGGFQSLLLWKLASTAEHARPRLEGCGNGGFNPCCHGSVGSLGGRKPAFWIRSPVSILVVMEFGQRLLNGTHDRLTAVDAGEFQSLLSWKAPVSGADARRL